MIPDEKLTPRQWVWRQLKHNMAAYMAAEIDRIKMEREHEEA